MLEIIPAILTNNPQELKEMINLVEGKCEKIQIDIVDGVFADNKTIEPSALNFIETNLKIDFQLMVKEPASWVEKCIRAGGERIIGHVELMSSQLEFIEKVQKAGALVGLGLDIDTPISIIEENLFKDLDVILVMSVKAGFGNQEFRFDVLEKVNSLSKLKKKNNFSFRICVDGGITPSSIREVYKAGADEAVIGRRIFKEGNVENNLKMFEEKIN
jgi:ribulose-phosphate 3-epimerase